MSKDYSTLTKQEGNNIIQLDYNKEVMLKVINKRPELGKTAVMKLMFILQQSFDMRLGHTFNLYTYGPYSSSVTEDLENLIHAGLVEAGTYEYKNSLAYSLTSTEKCKTAFTPSTVSIEDDLKIDKVIKLFGDKTAKDLELDSTKIYIKNQYERNRWQESKQDIIENVHSIKPHFSTKEIQDAYDGLNNILYSE